MTVAAQDAQKNTVFETYTRKVFSDWRGPDVVDAMLAATELGVINSGGGMSELRALALLDEGFKAHGVDNIHWSSVRGAFNHGRTVVTNPSQLRARFFPPKAANDNPKPAAGFAAFCKPAFLVPGGQPDGATVRDRFTVTWFHEVDQGKVKEEILQGVLGAEEFSLFVAKPGTAKSVLVGDIGMHIAAGIDWHGRKVKPGLVVFFAAERKSLTERRVAAWSKHHDIKNIPFVVVGGKLDLTAGVVDAKALATVIEHAELKSGQKCNLIILDTVTRTFGSGDQHQSKDMQKYVQSVDELSRATGAHVAAIHHSTWSEDRGKGAIDLDGAIDVSFGVTVKGTGPAKTFTLACTGSNDGEEGVVTTFQLTSVQLGTDAAGKATTAPVVFQVDAVAEASVKPKGKAGNARSSLERAITEVGVEPPTGSPGFPLGMIVANRSQWRQRFFADTLLKEPALLESTLTKRFQRAVTELTGAEHVGNVGEWFWLDSRT